MRVLILGVTGMLGSAVFRAFTLKPQDLTPNSQTKNDAGAVSTGFEVFGICRNFSSAPVFQKMLQSRPAAIRSGVDVLQEAQLEKVLVELKPDVVINCVGVIKQKKDGLDPVQTIALNALLPHRLAQLGKKLQFRLVHFSTDCVFSGKKGLYLESDFSDADDLYGRSKFLGEVIDSESAITIRSSIIGHELNSNYSLVNWFLSQSHVVDGYKKAIYSGLPTVEMAQVLKNMILPNKALHGLYHVSSQPISKFDLLHLIKMKYKKNIEIRESSTVQIDRSLNSQRFQNETGYRPPNWEELVHRMHTDAMKEELYV